MKDSGCCAKISQNRQNSRGLRPQTPKKSAFGLQGPHALPNLDPRAPKIGPRAPGAGTCPMSMDQGHAQCPWSMDMPNQWVRTAQGPTNGPERPRVQQLGPNGPGSNNWARTAQGPTIGPERPRVQQLGPNGPGPASSTPLQKDCLAGSAKVQTCWP